MTITAREFNRDVSAAKRAADNGPVTITDRGTPAYVLLTEALDRPAPSGARQAGGYAYRLRAVGHLFEAEDEAQEWPELHATIRDARTHYQAAGEMPDWQALEGLLAAAMKTTRLETGS